jgi:hypothetical protein
MVERIPNREALIELYRWAKGEEAKRETGLLSEWDQVEWLGYRLDSDGNRCGTVCCLAGKAVIDAGAVPYGKGTLATNARTMLYSTVELNGWEMVPVPVVAAKILGLTPEWANLLFYSTLTLSGVREVMSAILGEEVDALA